jgi:hypothetical protein
MQREGGGELGLGSSGAGTTPAWKTRRSGSWMCIRTRRPCPYGYQTMAFIALTPPLWRHIMRPLLADWDKRFASEAERAVVRERGWEGVA